MLDSTDIIASIEMKPGEPLRKRVPTHDEDGRPLSDFMMLIPRLRNKPHDFIRSTIDEIQKVLECYEKTVVFADLNLQLNLLWVSIKPIQGIYMELVTAIQMRVPEAKLVGHQ